MLFKRSKHRKPKYRPTRAPVTVPGPTATVLRRPQDFLGDNMEQRPATPGEYRKPSAPLAGQVIGVRPVTNPETRVLRAVSDETSVMPAATALPPSVAVPAQPDLRDVQARVVAALGAPARPAFTRRADGLWFRPGSDTTASDLSLATFHRRWFAQMGADVALNAQASPKTVVMTAIGHADFPGSGVAR